MWGIVTVEWDSMVNVIELNERLFLSVSVGDAYLPLTPEICVIQSVLGNQANS